MLNGDGVEDGVWGGEDERTVARLKFRLKAAVL